MLDQQQIAHAILGLDNWLDSIRSTQGYGGPVSHWWRNSLLYTGRGLDWRYEGIICGYLKLWEAGRELIWLKKAKRAGDDLVNGQLSNGHYPASAFEINPASAGTPHEAACDYALLKLALVLEEEKDPNWEKYAFAAKKNLTQYIIGKLWDEDAKIFRDTPDSHSFVSNKAATICQALFLLAELEGEDKWVEHYALSALDRILSCQINDGGPLDGGIFQEGIGSQIGDKYFPLYISRCIPALVNGYEWSGKSFYLEGALNAMRFVLKNANENGSFPQVIYPGGRCNIYPQWVAGVGEILWGLDLVENYGFDGQSSFIQEWLINGQLPFGGFRTGHGFGKMITQENFSNAPDLLDLLPVAGWSDKAFRWLCSKTDGPLIPPSDTSYPSYEMVCTYYGKELLFKETHQAIEVTHKGERVYFWQKGEWWAVASGDLFCVF